MYVAYNLTRWCLIYFYVMLLCTYNSCFVSKNIPHTLSILEFVVVESRSSGHSDTLTKRKRKKE